MLAIITNQHSVRGYFFFLGTLAPFSRASDSPMAIACFRDFTLRPLPLFSVPRFRRRMVLATRFDAAFPYFRPPLRRALLFLRAPVRRRAAMITPGRRPSARYALASIEQFSRRVSRDPASRVMPNVPNRASGGSPDVQPRSARAGNFAIR